MKIYRLTLTEFCFSVWDSSLDEEKTEYFFSSYILLMRYYDKNHEKIIGDWCCEEIELDTQKIEKIWEK